MKPWFRQRSPDPASAQVDDAPASDSVVAARADVRAARAEDRRAARRSEARVRRRGFPLFSLLILMVVIFGALMLYLAASHGSFSQGGAVVDQSLSKAAAPIKGAEDEAGTALEKAGGKLKQAAGSSNP